MKKAEIESTHLLERGMELKYRAETVIKSIIVDLVNDVLRKKHISTPKYGKPLVKLR